MSTHAATTPTGPSTGTPLVAAAPPGSPLLVGTGVATSDRHLPGLRGVGPIKTRNYTQARTALGRAVRVNGIAVIDGRPGNGKTFTVNNFLNTHPEASERPKVWLDIPQSPSPKEVTMRVLKALGAQFNPRDPQYTLTEELVPLLTGRELILVIDEAQNLKTKGLQQMRYFHDRCQVRNTDDPGGFALVLAGAGVAKTMSGAAELGSRVTAWFEFKPMDHEQTLIALRSWHPLLAQLPPEALLDYDRRLGCGNWRNWAQILAALIDLHDRATTRTQAKGTDMPALTALAEAALNAVRRDIP